MGSILIKNLLMNKIKQIGAFLFVAFIIWVVGELVQSFTNRWDWWEWLVYLIVFLVVFFISLLCVAAWILRDVYMRIDDDECELYLK